MLAVIVGLLALCFLSFLLGWLLCALLAGGSR